MIDGFFKKYCLLLLTLLCVSMQLHAQKKKLVHINFAALIHKNTLQVGNTYYTLNNSDSFCITNFKFYVSAVRLVYNSKTVFTEANSYHLLNFNNENAHTKISCNIPADIVFNELQFAIGIDSVTNVKGLLTGCLDPLQGMYWTWNSGYINIKMEGNSNICKTWKNAFQWHIGGYRTPFNTLKKVVLPISSLENIHVGINVNRIFNTQLLQQTPLIMTPGKAALQIATFFSEAFFVMP
jgi:hypothetical protein